jgi:hypothetical protein
MGKTSKEAPFKKITIGRGETSENDVEVAVRYCAYCHTDINLMNNDWGFTSFPCIAGLEERFRQVLSFMLRGWNYIQSTLSSWDQPDRILMGRRQRLNFRQQIKRRKRQFKIASHYTKQPAEQLLLRHSCL